MPRILALVKTRRLILPISANGHIGASLVFVHTTLALYQSTVPPLHALIYRKTSSVQGRI